MLPKVPFQYPWYEGPGYYKIKLEPSEVKRMSNYPEVVLIKEINGLTFSAIVPSHTLGENDSWVPAEYAGMIGDKAVFYLPTGNDGRPTWRVPKELLDQMLLS